MKKLGFPVIKGKSFRENFFFTENFAFFCISFAHENNEIFRQKVCEKRTKIFSYFFRESFCSLETLGETHKNKHFLIQNNNCVFHIFNQTLCKNWTNKIFNPFFYMCKSLKY